MTSDRREIERLKTEVSERDETIRSRDETIRSMQQTLREFADSLERTLLEQVAVRERGRGIKPRPLSIRSPAPSRQ